MPSQNQISGIIRIVVPALLAYAAGAGWIHVEDSGTYSDAIVNGIIGLISIAMMIWSGHSNSDPQIVASAAAIPEVATVQIKPTPEGIALKKAAGSTPEALVVLSPKTAGKIK